MISCYFIGYLEQVQGLQVYCSNHNKRILRPIMLDLLRMMKLVGVIN